MTKFFLPLFLVSILGWACSGCAHKPKSSAHLYEGDSPNVRYVDRPEAAGGRINPY